MDFVDQIQQTIEHMENGVHADDVEGLAGSLSALETDCAGKQQAVSVIKMMHSLTKYLATRMDKAHPGTLPVLGTLAENLTNLLASPAVEDQAQILSESKHTFKSLKSAIESGKLILDSEMEELKAVILAVDWEISSITMKGFDRVLSRLEQRLKSYKMHYTFLRIMHQVGAHIANRKADAHQDSVSLLRWVFRQYELLVAHPDMAPDKKKEMLQENIQAYKAFKAKIDGEESFDPGTDQDHVAAARTIQDSAPNPLPGRDSSEGDTFAPALSHTNKESSDAEDDLFIALADPMTDPAPKETLSVEDDAMMPQRDVMSDLFAMKESPADELLDAIHLSSVHGPDQENASAMPGVMGGAEKKAGVQQVTPERMDNTPIPEIESRLDAFFNLDASSAGTKDQEEPSESQALDHIDDFETENALSEESVDLPSHIASIPDMQADDIALEDLQDHDDGALPGVFPEDDTDGGMPAPNLVDLCNLLSDPEALTSLDIFEQVQEKVVSLNDIWDPDSDKVRLLSIVSSMTRFIHQQALPDTEDEGGDKDSEFDEYLDGMETAEPNGVEEMIENQDSLNTSEQGHPSVFAPDDPAESAGDAPGQPDAVQQTAPQNNIEEDQEVSGEDTPTKLKKKGFFARLKARFKG